MNYYKIINGKIIVEEKNELKIGDTVISYFFFSERKGIITRFERNRYNKVLGKLNDLVWIKFDDNEKEEAFEEKEILFEKPKSWNGHGTFVEL